MRNPREIKNIIINFVKTDHRVRAVLLNGSRANSKVETDALQDFDVVFIVENLTSFIDDRTWLQSFGKVILQQLPDEMKLGKENNCEKPSFTFLMIFEDGNRIDLTLFPVEKLETEFIPDSLTIVWLDKDNLFSNIPPSSDSDYHIKKPGESEFAEVCNEFWWTITYVAKGLKRNEVIYAKEMMEIVVRPMFWKLMEWKIGFENNFEVSAGKSGKFAKNFLTEELYQNILKTYADADLERNWNSLLLMAQLFEYEQKYLANQFYYLINEEEIQNSKQIVKDIRFL